MRGSKPAGFSGVGERAARSLDRLVLCSIMLSLESLPNVAAAYMLSAAAPPAAASSRPESSAVQLSGLRTLATSWSKLPSRASARHVLHAHTPVYRAAHH